MKHGEILNKFIEIELRKCRAGSGDDEFYANQIIKFVDEQKLFLLQLIKFVEKEVQKK